MYHLFVVSLVALLSLITTACNSSSANNNRSAREPTAEPAKPAEPKPAPEARWDKRRLKLPAFPGHDAEASLVLGDDGTIELKIDGRMLPDESRIELAGRSAQTDDREQLRVPVDLSGVALDELGATAVSELVKAPLVVTVPGHLPLSVELPRLDARPALAKLFERVEARPIRLSGDREGAPLDTAVVVGRKLEPVGTGRTVGDIDWVAITKPAPGAKVEKTCTGYKKGPVILTLHDKTAQIFNRRTGELVAEKTLSVSRACPRMVYVDGKNRASYTVPTRKVTRWVSDRLRQKRASL